MYTPVPVVAAGDWIDEVFINTYWVDNMAAGIPDLFTAKGQLPVGLGVDSMGILNVGSNGKSLVADSAEALGMKWDTRTKFTFPSSYPNLTGLSTAVGSETITATNISGVPASAIALILLFKIKWADVSGYPYMQIKRAAGQVVMDVEGQVNGKNVSCNGIVPLSSGTFIITIGIAAATYVSGICQGYVE